MASKASKKRAKQSDGQTNKDSSDVYNKKDNNPVGVLGGATLSKGFRRNGAEGRLVPLIRMPVDIFCEVSGNLSPADLLNIARSSKSWRAILTSKKSKPIWRAARNGMSIPECPDDLSEPEYADLLFGKGCHNCSAPQVKGLWFALRLRLCKRCSNRKLGGGRGIANAQHKDLSGDKDIFLLAPYHKASDDRNNIYVVDDFKLALAKYMHLNSGAREKFLQDRKMRNKGIVAHAALVTDWIKLEDLKKNIEKEGLINRRRESIYSRLKKLGYNERWFQISDEEYYKNDRRWHNLVEAPKELTERGWKLIRSKLEIIIRRRKELGWCPDCGFFHD